MLKVNGVVIATPKTLKVDIKDIEKSSKRNAKGDYLRKKLATKVTIDCSWKPLNMHEISTILNAVKDTYISVEYPDPLAGNFVTKTFFVQSKSAPLFLVINGQYLWEGLSMSFEEK